jgi:hypothetical protein
MHPYSSELTLTFTLRVLGSVLLVAVLVIALGAFRRRRADVFKGLGLFALTLIAWAALYAARPHWLRRAMDASVAPMSAQPQWLTRAPGIDTAELEVRVGDEAVDVVALTRLDPHAFELSVHWDPTGSKTAEDWQKELGAAVVINGSYFLPDGSPQTPLRAGGHSLGPSHYASTHGALVVDTGVDILDLRGQDTLLAIKKYPEAMVSYPLLLDRQGTVRAAGSAALLASRSFVAIDSAGRVVLGTTETGYFSLHRLAEFLKAAPLDLQVALNLDGGPVASQVVAVGAYSRATHGTAEVSDPSDVLRAFWQTRRNAHWHLPIVLAATERHP